MMKVAMVKVAAAAACVLLVLGIGVGVVVKRPARADGATVAEAATKMSGAASTEPAVPTTADAQRRADTEKLLEAVRDTRSASLAMVISGRGVAELESTDIQNKREIIVPRHRVEFVFDGGDSLWKEYDPKDSKKLVSATLVMNGRRICYSSGGGARLKGIEIDAVDETSSTIDLEPRSWSYRELARIPLLREKNFFPIWARKPYATISKENSAVSITIPYPLEKDNPGNVTLDRAVTTFDMAAGGHLSAYEYVNESGKGKSQLKETDKLVLTWKRDGTAYVPLSRTVDARYERAGKEWGVAASRVDFKEFTAGPLKPGEFELKQLNIPDGILVGDHVRREQYEYYDDIADKITGTSVPTTAPATAPAGSR